MTDTPDSKRTKRIEDSFVAQSRTVVLIIDYGSQYTQLITRRCGLSTDCTTCFAQLAMVHHKAAARLSRRDTFYMGFCDGTFSSSARSQLWTLTPSDTSPQLCRVRELGFLSIMISGDTDLDRVKGISPKAIILSGGPNSVHEGTSPGLPAGFFDYTDSTSIPVLGICYGMQLIAHTLGGTVKTSPTGGEFGRMAIKQQASAVLYAEEPSDTQQVWMSHGDDVVELPSGFVCAAKSMQDITVAIEDPKRRIFGLQVLDKHNCISLQQERASGRQSRASHRTLYLLLHLSFQWICLHFVLCVVWCTLCTAIRTAVNKG